MNKISSYQKEKFKYRENHNQAVFQDKYKFEIIRNLILDYLKNNPKKKIISILDLGCYDGHFLHFLKDFFKASDLEIKYYGVDISQDALDSIHDNSIIVIQCDLEDSNYSKSILDLRESIDIVVSSDVLEHLFYSENLVKLANFLIASRGIFILASPNVASLGRRMMLLFGGNPYLEISSEDKDSVGHIRFYTFSMLEKLLFAYGFGVIRKASDYITIPLFKNLIFSRLANVLPTFGKTIILVSTLKKRY